MHICSITVEWGGNNGGKKKHEPSPLHSATHTKRQTVKKCDFKSYYSSLQVARRNKKFLMKTKNILRYIANSNFQEDKIFFFFFSSSMLEVYSSPQQQDLHYV